MVLSLLVILVVVLLYQCEVLYHNDHAQQVRANAISNSDGYVDELPNGIERLICKNLPEAINIE